MLDAYEEGASVCDCEGTVWDEYCDDADADGLGDIATIQWVCPSSAPAGFIEDCSDEDDACFSNVHDCASPPSTGHQLHSFGAGSPQPHPASVLPRQSQSPAGMG